MKKSVIGMLLISTLLISACNSVEEIERYDFPPGIMYSGNVYVITDDYVNINLLGDKLGTIISVISSSKGMPSEAFQTNAYREGEPIFSYGEDDSYIVVYSNQTYELLKISE